MRLPTRPPFRRLTASALLSGVFLILLGACSPSPSLVANKALLTAGTLVGDNDAYVELEWEGGEYYLLETHTRHGGLTVLVIGPNGDTLPAQTDPLADHTVMRTLFTPAKSGTYKVTLKRKRANRTQSTFELYASSLLHELEPDHPAVTAMTAHSLANESYAASFEAEGEQRLSLYRSALEKYQESSKHLKRGRYEQEHLVEQYRTAIVLRRLELQKKAIETLAPVVDGLTDANLAAWAAATLGSQLGRTGQPESARRAFKQGLDRVSNAEKPDLYALASLQNYLALSFHRNAQHEEAIKWYNQALQTAKLTKNERQIAMTLGNLGGVHFNRSEASLALNYFHQLLESSTASDNQTGVRKSLGNIGSVHLTSGDYAKALDTFAQVAQLIDATADPKSYARNLQRQAQCYSGIGDFEQAETLVRVALELLKLQPEKPRIASVTASLAEAALNQRKFEDAFELASEAKALYQESNNKPGIRRNLVNAIRASEGLGDLGKAESLHSELAQLSLSEETPRQRAERMELSTRVKAMSYRSKNSRAPLSASHYVSLSQINFQCPANEPSALEADENTNPQISSHPGELHTLFAEFEQSYCIYLDNGHTLNALKVLTGASELALEIKAYEAAASLARNAFELIDTSLAHVSIPAQRAQFLARHLQVYDIALEAYAQLHVGAPEGRYHLSALQARERAQGRLLINERLTPAAPTGESLNDERIKKRNNLLRDYYATLSASNSTKKKDPKQVKQRLAKLKSELDAADLKAGIELKAEAPALNLTAMLASISPEDLILVYWLNDTNTLLWALQKDSAVLHLLPPRSSIQPHIETLVPALRDGQLGSAIESGQELGRHLLAPVTQQLQGKSVYLVLDAELNSLAFSSLTVPDLDKQLVDVAPSQVLPSLAFYKQNPGGRSRRYNSLAVVSDPIYSASDSRVKSAPKPEPLLAELTRSVDQTLPLRRLAHSSDEARFISSFFQGTALASFNGFSASRHNLFDQGLNGKDILHMAVHGESHSSLPELSSLRLSRLDPSGNLLEHRLTPSDIRQLPMSPKLVVLSACDTATGPLIRGEGYLSLAQAFLGRGAEQVVASLWPVPDDSTAELMKLFYQQLLEHKLPPHEALQKAQQELRQSSHWQDAYFWSGFIVVGQNSTQ